MFGHRLAFWPTVVVVVGCVFLTKLGFWQLDRAQQKRDLQAAYNSRASGEPIDLNIISSQMQQGHYMSWRRITGSGRYDPSRQFLLDNQIAGGRVGYFVFSPFLLQPGERWVLVNRGWIPQGGDRETIPDIQVSDTPTAISGVAKHPSRPAIVLAGGETEALGHGIWRVQLVDIERLAEELQRDFLPYLVRLDPQAEDGYLRDWHAPGAGDERHIAYAVQWFAMALVLVAVYVRTIATGGIETK